MINARELRHGNYYYFTGNSEDLFDYKDKIGKVMLNDNCCYYVSFMDISNEMLDYFSVGESSPIELTEDILIKCGVEKSAFQNQWRFCCNYLVDNKDGSYSLSVGDEEIEVATVKYLHQLQNLFYCLTGKELEIKEL